MGVFEEVERDAAAAGHGITGLSRQQHPRPGGPPRPALPAPVTEAVRNRPEPSEPVQEETVSPVSAALAAVQHQAAALERDTAANPLAVVISARHVGKAFTHAECVAIADFIAALEAEKRTQDGGQSRAAAAAAAAANGSGIRQTGPQQQVTA